MPCMICNEYCDMRKICWFCVDEYMMYESIAMSAYGITKEEITLNNLFCLEVPNPHKPYQKSHKYLIAELEVLFEKIINSLADGETKKLKMIRKKKLLDEKRKNAIEIESNVEHKIKEINDCLKMYLDKLDKDYLIFFAPTIARLVEENSRSKEKTNLVAIRIYCEIEKLIEDDKHMKIRKTELDKILLEMYNKTQFNYLNKQDSYKKFVKNGDIQNIDIIIEELKSEHQRKSEEINRKKKLENEMKNLHLFYPESWNHYVSDYVYHNTITLDEAIYGIAKLNRFESVARKKGKAFKDSINYYKGMQGLKEQFIKCNVQDEHIIIAEINNILKK